jgi:hypothetical protein
LFFLVKRVSSIVQQQARQLEQVTQKPTLDLQIGTRYNQLFCDISHILLLEGARLQWGLVVFHPTTAAEESGSGSMAVLITF